MKPVGESRIGSIGRGLLHTVLSAILLIGVPLLIIRIIDDPAFLDVLVGRWIDASGAVDLLEQLDLGTVRTILERAVWSAPAMVVLAFPLHFYDEGNRGRMRFRILRAIVGIARYLYIINLGDLAGIIGWQDPGTDSFVAVDLLITGYLLVRIVIDLLDIPMAWAELRDNRERFLEEHTDYYGNLVKRSRAEIRAIRKERGERSRTQGIHRRRRCT